MSSDQWEKLITNRTYTATDDGYVKVIWWDIYFPKTWAYIIEWSQNAAYVQNDQYTVRMYIDNKKVYSERLMLKDGGVRMFTLTLWRRNRIRITVDDEAPAQSTPEFVFKFIKL